MNTHKEQKYKKEKKGIVLELATHGLNGEVLIVKAIKIYEPYLDTYRLFLDKELRVEIKKIEKWLI